MRGVLPKSFTNIVLVLLVAVFVALVAVIIASSNNEPKISANFVQTTPEEDLATSSAVSTNSAQPE